MSDTTDTAVTAFLGDRDRSFDLLPQLHELERVTGAATGSILKRIIAGDFHNADCPSVVRLALIGAGETPLAAAALAAAHVSARPLIEGHALATAIMLAAWAGNKTPATAESPAATDGDLAPAEVAS